MVKNYILPILLGIVFVLCFIFGQQRDNRMIVDVASYHVPSDLRQDYAILVDYRKHISKKRLYVINIKTKSVVFKTYVSHGYASGKGTPKVFSNRPGSHMSSLGKMKTGEFYFGKNGKSVRLHGLERQNSNVYKRAIVIHPSGYMSIKRKHNFGHSEGCLSIPPEHVSMLYRYIKKDMFIMVLGN